MTMPQPIPFFPATGDFPSGADTPRDLLERCLARFEDFEPAVGAFVCHDICAARTVADLATERWRAGRSL
jgi:Asp-tRNA(Asn)/Glu-tRNA(Gln) amidotransferase A subunit family amidase